MSQDIKKSPLTEEQMVALMDETTVFNLAALMLETYTGMLIKNTAMLAHSLQSVGVVLKNNPGFTERFKKAQSAIIDQMRKPGPPSKQVLTPTEFTPPDETL